MVRYIIRINTGGAPFNLLLPPHDRRMDSEERVFFNAKAQRQEILKTRNTSVLQFHQQVLSNYKPTKLTRFQCESSLCEVFVKEESDRFGLPAFKVLGSSYATFVELCDVYNLDVNKATLQQLRSAIQQAERETPILVTATDGNHGRGLAWFAKLLGLRAHVFVPHSVSQKAIEHIQSEGSLVEQLTLDYDAAVQHAAEFCEENKSRLLIQDTSWDNYIRIPRNIVEGYATIFYELDESQATHIVCPVGVGSLAQACVEFAPSTAKIITVEPLNAPCLSQSLQLGKITKVRTEQTIMAGLNCGLVSKDAWPVLLNGVDASVLVTDEEALQAMKELQSHNIDAGPCGAASLAAWKVLCESKDSHAQLGLNKTSKIILLITEGTSAV